MRRRGAAAQILAVFVAALMFTAIPGVARAQDKQEKQEKQEKKLRATKLLIEGQKLHDAGEYAEALGRFEKAYALVPSPKIQFNFGLAYNGLDRPSDAIRAFQSFLEEAGDAAPANVAKAREYLAKLNRKVGVLELDGDVSGAEVSVDGRSYGASTKVVLDPGPHQLTVDKSGHAPFLSRLTISAGDRPRVTVRFNDPMPQQPATLAPTARLPANPGGPVALGGPPLMSGPAMATPTPQSEEPRDNPAGTAAAPWQYTAGWVSTGISAVLLAGGLAGRLMANKKYADFNAYRDSRTPMCNRALRPDSGGPSCREFLSAGDTYSALSWVGVIGGGVAAVAAVVFFVSAPSSTSHTETAFTCAPTLGYAGASCRMAF
jgi:hypothetical protein